jgi:hypothetical protein
MGGGAFYLIWKYLGMVTNNLLLVLKKLEIKRPSKLLLAWDNFITKQVFKK